ncbi:MAG: protease HtpX [Kiritimatiellae bacterium]|nr:protease HtpX [Kiritimatiellia bacterium]
MKRVFLFVLTNIAVMLVLSVVFTVVCAVLGVPSAQFDEYGINYLSLAVFSLVFGMGGALISLLLSKPMAKYSVGARTVTGKEGPAEAWLVETVADLAQRAGVKTPEVAIYQGPANAFATGAFKNSALVAVSTDIMAQMTRQELRAVLGHEMSHVRNGDMVTMTLLQGVLNAVVLFASQIVGIFIDGLLSGKGGRRRSRGIGYILSRYVCQIVLGIAASFVVMGFSRRREYAADAGSADLAGSPQDMIAALRRLSNLQPGVLPDSLKAMGIGGRSMKSLLASHPPIEERIRALESWHPPL